MTLPPPREGLRTGIVHFGPGAFHRAHQADYVDRLLDDDPRWGIAAVSLRSAGTVEALARQEGVYTLAILDAARTRFHPIRAHNRFLSPTDAAAVRALLAEPQVRIVSSTVTEKGYCLALDGSLDFDHPDIVHDLSAPRRPRSIVGWLTLGLSDRRAARLAPFAPLCCDNIVSNGKKLRGAVLAYAARIDPELARWIADEVRFPDTMVDSITPATDDGLRALVRRETGWDDDAPVSREAYAAWIIEDVLAPDGPDFAAAGATLAADVGAWEKAKLRILNGAHSSLAYLGLLLGHETVADAMADAQLAGFVEAMVREDVIASLAPSPLDLQAYASEILERFRNPAIGHKLSQIAWDGSQKLPYRLLETVADALAAGRPVERLAVPIAAWIGFLARQARAGTVVVDPLAEELAAAAVSPAPVASILALRRVFPAGIAEAEPFRAAVAEAHARLSGADPRRVLPSA